MILLPVEQTSAFFSFQTELDGVTYGLAFRWNSRSEQWFFDLEDGEGNALITGIAVVINQSLLGRFAVDSAAGLPPGILAALDSSSGGVDAGFEDLGRRVLLYYATAADLASLGL